MRKLDANYFRRVKAIEFAVKYDDGRDPQGLKRADIVLIGISRTSKKHRFLSIWPIKG
ncbi:hypothetical protein GCM10020331_013030 [Ectobacillus funiculus]